MDAWCAIVGINDTKATSVHVSHMDFVDRLRDLAVLFASVVGAGMPMGLKAGSSSRTRTPTASQDLNEGQVYIWSICISPIHEYIYTCVC